MKENGEGVGSGIGKGDCRLGVSHGFCWCLPRSLPNQGPRATPVTTAWLSGFPELTVLRRVLSNYNF